MFKNILIITPIILLTLASNTNAMSNSAFELEPKYYDIYSFKVDTEMFKEKDYYDQYYKEGINSNIPSLLNKKYEFSNDGQRRVVKSKDEFEISYLLQQVEKNPTNKEFYNCYKGLEAQLIDNRYYSLPMLSNDPMAKPVTNGAEPKNKVTIVENQFRIIPQYSIALVDYKINEPESNYNFFKVENNVVKSITNREEIKNESFNVCIETVSGKYTNGNREGIDIVYTYVKPEDKNTINNVIKRSVFGNNDKPTVDIDIENRRIVALKTNTPPKDPNKTNDLFVFIFYGIPILAILYFVYKFIVKLRDR